jgi:pimeloyl-ACP methyl ester carboxylesterase
MNDKWIVFGGWGIAPDILRPVFGSKSVYIDINDIMSKLFVNNEISLDWLSIVNDVVKPFCKSSHIRIAGWSTGAIIACAISTVVNTESLVLLSATPSFCRREGFRFGIRASVLSAMRSGLAKSDNSVLKDFAVLGCIPEEFVLTNRYSVDSLQKGLEFLEQVNLLAGISHHVGKTLLLHGKNDAVIPCGAGEYLAKMLGAEIKLFEGGHAFFVDHADFIRHQIRF